MGARNIRIVKATGSNPVCSIQWGRLSDRDNRPYFLWCISAYAQFYNRAAQPIVKKRSGSRLILVGAHFCNSVAEADPAVHLFVAAAVDLDRFAAAVDRFKPDRMPLEEFAEVYKPGGFIEEDSGVAVTDRALADQKDIILLIDRI